MFLHLYKKELTGMQTFAHEHDETGELDCSNAHEKVIANSICSSVKIFQYLTQKYGWNLLTLPFTLVCSH